MRSMRLREIGFYYEVRATTSNALGFSAKTRGPSQRVNSNVSYKCNGSQAAVEVGPGHGQYIYIYIYIYTGTYIHTYIHTYMKIMIRTMH